MRFITSVGVVWVLFTSITGCFGGSGRGSNDPADVDVIEIVNVSYDPTRELYEEINEAFTQEYQKTHGKSVRVTQSHGGSGSQARSVIDGLQADVVTLALAGDINAIAKKQLMATDWESRLPENSAPYTSTIVFLVREGNPKGIKDWEDLAKPGVKVITPNPKISGGARWNFLAAWGHIKLTKKGSDAEAQELVGNIYRNVVKLDTGARGSAQTFIKNKLGDVFISWENEAILAQREVPNQKLAIVYPTSSILAEPAVAVVDRNADQRGTRAVAEAYLQFLYTDAAQDIIGKNTYRPRDAVFQKKYAATLPPIKTFTIREVAGSWAEAHLRFFSDGGIFDQIYSLRK